MEKLHTFENNGETAVILTPRPPRHWYNYLWNDRGYCAQVSQMGHGKSWYITDKAEMCALNCDSARYVFLRDDSSGSFWCPGQGPAGVPVEDFRCEHSLAESTVSSRRGGIFASWRIFVPTRGTHEVWTVTVKNESGQTRSLSLFSAVTFSLEGFAYPRYYEMYRCMETSFDAPLRGVYCASRHPFAPHSRYNGFLASSEPPAAFDGDLSVFCGTESTLTRPDASAAALFQRPETVAEGRDCSNSSGALFILGGVLQHKLTLAPGESRTLHFAFGVSESLKEAREVGDSLTDDAVEAALAGAWAELRARYGSLTLSTPDGRINALMSGWVKKQVDFCIVGKKGVRDNLQIAVALLNYRPEKAKAEILECLRHQFRDGHAVLTWYPYDDTRYSDQPFWIIWAVCELIKETGDFGILNEPLSWQDGGQAPVREHLKAAARCLLTDLGPHGLVRIRFADWNDALNVTTDDQAESVMLSHQTCLALRELAELMRRDGDTAYAEGLERERAALRERINLYAWDGGWYSRALSREENIGSRDSRGSKIYLNAQTWAVLGDVVPPERLPDLLRAVDGMEHDFGFPLNLPPYEGYTPHTGRMSGMLPGLFENGGVYCHATGFKVLMDCKLGRAAKALETMKKIMPDSDLNPSARSGAEPWVFTNCYSTHPKYYGKSYQSWTTGTSAWCLMGVYEGILGVKRGYDGLTISPCLPASWDHASVTRRFRGTDYRITIENPHHVESGPVTLAVDGVPTPWDTPLDLRDGKVHNVIATVLTGGQETSERD